MLKALPPEPGKGEEYTVHFFDRQPLLLFGKGLIVRMRQRSEKTGDATFKVRGDDAASTFKQFGDVTKDRKLEGDQNVGAKVKESFSITSEPPLAKIADVLAGAVRLSAAFEPDAARLLDAAGELGMYGPIAARKWKVKLAGFDGKVTVEWWKTGAVELIELSDKVAAGDAGGFANALGEHMQLLGLSQLLGSKTEFALENSDYRPLVVGPKV